MLKGISVLINMKFVEDKNILNCLFHHPYEHYTCSDIIKLMICESFMEHVASINNPKLQKNK